MSAAEAAEWIRKLEKRLGLRAGDHGTSPENREKVAFEVLNYESRVLEERPSRDMQDRLQRLAKEPSDETARAFRALFTTYCLRRASDRGKNKTNRRRTYPISPVAKDNEKGTDSDRNERPDTSATNPMESARDSERGERVAKVRSRYIASLKDSAYKVDVATVVAERLIDGWDFHTACKGASVARDPRVSRHEMSRSMANAVIEEFRVSFYKAWIGVSGAGILEVHEAICPKLTEPQRLVSQVMIDLILKGQQATCAAVMRDPRLKQHRVDVGDIWLQVVDEIAKHLP